MLDLPASMPLDRALPFFRAVAPTAAGVVLASAGGAALASDLRAADAEAFAARAAALHVESRGRAPLASRLDGASIFVPSPEGPVLVVFLDAAHHEGVATRSFAVAA